jgi:hypothetical protein
VVATVGEGVWVVVVEEKMNPDDEVRDGGFGWGGGGGGGNMNPGSL